MNLRAAVASSNMERRLAAILAADVVGFSRLVGNNEERTIARLRELRSSLIDPCVTSYNGRIVKTTGDGVLIEFPSVVSAVRCAVEAQEALAKANSNLPLDERIEFRVGINLGDVVVQDEDILGDGVNVAARLEGLAEPGGVCISGTTFDQVKGKLDLPFIYLGEREVKNIDEAVRVYKIALDEDDHSQPVSKASWSPRIGVMVVLPLAALIFLGGAYLWFRQIDGTVSKGVSPSREIGATRPPSPAASQLQASDKPSIAVLAFQNMSNDAKQEYFSDGMSEDIITGLSKLSSLFVIARNSSFQYKGKAIDVKRIGRELGVRYIVEGSVRRVSDKVRITAQLIDARTGGHLWADQYDGTLGDVFTFQDQVTRQIVRALSVQLGVDDIVKLAERGTKSVTAHDSFLKGQELARRHSLKDLGSAVAHYKRALEFDPNYSRASAAIAQIYYYVWRDDAGMGRQGGLPWPNEAIRLAKQYAKKALENPVPAAHIAEALLLQPARRYTEAIQHAQSAIALDPNDAAGYLGLANLLVLAGQPERSIANFEHARRLDPHNGDKVDQGIGLAYFGMDRFVKAMQHLERSRNSAPENNLTWMYLAATYAHLGQAAKAAAAVDQTNKLRLAQGINTFRADMIFLWFFKEKEDENRLKRGLIKAGFPAKSF